MWTKALEHLQNTAALFFWLGKQKSRGIEEEEGRLINRHITVKMSHLTLMITSYFPPFFKTPKSHDPNLESGFTSNYMWIQFCEDIWVCMCLNVLSHLPGPRCWWGSGPAARSRSGGVWQSLFQLCARVCSQHVPDDNYSCQSVISSSIIQARTDSNLKWACFIHSEGLHQCHLGVVC